MNAAFVWVVGEDGCASAIAEETSADEDADVVVKEESGAADFDADGEDMLAAAGIEQGVSGCEIRQGCATALPNEIKIEEVRAQAEALTDVAGEARTQVAGAGADKEGIDLPASSSGVGKGAFGGLGCEQRRVPGVTGMKNVWSDIESFIDPVENKVA